MHAHIEKKVNRLNHWNYQSTVLILLIVTIKKVLNACCTVENSEKTLGMLEYWREMD